MTVALVPASVLEDPSSQGADQKTVTLAQQSAPSPPADQMATEAEGAGSKAAAISGGSHSSTLAQPAPAETAGGGGGTKDDPYARASLRPELDLAATFDLAARNDALFLSRVKPCLADGDAAATNISIAVSLDDRGRVNSASPLRPTVSPSAPPTAAEARVIAAIKACAPYHDIVLGRAPILKTLNSQAALAPAIARPGF